MFQAFVFCLCREWPDAAPEVRLRQTLVKYGLLAPEGASGSEQQQALEQLFAKRVMALKGM